jgi:antitoxin YefM
MSRATLSAVIYVSIARKHIENLERALQSDLRCALIGQQNRASPHSLTISRNGQYAVQVKSITYTAARENLASTINRVCEDQAPIVITRNRDQAVVMLSLEEYESLQETAYLLRSPANAKRLIHAVDVLKRGKGLTRKLKPAV